MKILITGGRGFLGSHLSNKMLNMNHDVSLILRDTPNFEQQILNFNPDVFIHCAWDGGNNYSSVNDIKQVDNVYQGINLIELLSKLPTKTKFLGFGSFAEYGTLNNRPALETDIEYPTNLYGLSKYTFKNYSKILCDKYNIEWGWIRPCYVYGPGDVNTRLIPSIINKLLNNEKIELDKCDKIIDYIYIDDFTDLVYSLVVGENIDGIYNICSGEQYKLRNVIDQICLLMNKQDNIIFNDLLTRELTSSMICGYNNKIKKYSKINNLIDLTEGLTRTINYYKNERSSNIKG